MHDVSALVQQMSQILQDIHHTFSTLDKTAHNDKLDALEAQRDDAIAALHEAFQQATDELQRKRTSDQDERAAARRKEDDEIAARRKAEDDEWVTRLQQEDVERLSKFEDDKKSAEDEADAKIEQVEQAAERMAAEGQTKLNDLEGKRQHINRMLDEHLKAPLPSPPTRRRRKAGAVLTEDATSSELVEAQQQPDEVLQKDITASEPGTTPKDAPATDDAPATEAASTTEEVPAMEEVSATDTQYSTPPVADGADVAPQTEIMAGDVEQATVPKDTSELQEPGDTTSSAEPVEEGNDASEEIAAPFKAEPNETELVESGPVEAEPVETQGVEASKEEPTELLSSENAPAPAFQEPALASMEVETAPDLTPEEVRAEAALTEAQEPAPESVESEDVLASAPEDIPAKVDPSETKEATFAPPVEAELIGPVHEPSADTAAAALDSTGSQAETPESEDIETSQSQEVAAAPEATVTANAEPSGEIEIMPDEQRVEIVPDIASASEPVEDVPALTTEGQSEGKAEAESAPNQESASESSFVPDQEADVTEVQADASPALENTQVDSKEGAENVQEAGPTPKELFDTSEIVQASPEDVLNTVAASSPDLQEASSVTKEVESIPEEAQPVHEAAIAPLQDEPPPAESEPTESAEPPSVAPAPEEQAPAAQDSQPCLSDPEDPVEARSSEVEPTAPQQDLSVPAETKVEQVCEASSAELQAHQAPIESVEEVGQDVEPNFEGTEGRPQETESLAEQQDNEVTELTPVQDHANMSNARIASEETVPGITVEAEPAVVGEIEPNMENVTAEAVEVVHNDDVEFTPAQVSQLTEVEFGTPLKTAASGPEMDEAISEQVTMPEIEPSPQTTVSTPEKPSSTEVADEVNEENDNQASSPNALTDSSEVAVLVEPLSFIESKEIPATANEEVQSQIGPDQSHDLTDSVSQNVGVTDSTSQLAPSGIPVDLYKGRTDVFAKENLPVSEELHAESADQSQDALEEESTTEAQAESHDIGLAQALPEELHDQAEFRALAEDQAPAPVAAASIEHTIESKAGNDAPYIDGDRDAITAGLETEPETESSVHTHVAFSADVPQAEADVTSVGSDTHYREAVSPLITRTGYDGTLGADRRNYAGRTDEDTDEMTPRAATFDSGHIAIAQPDIGRAEPALPSEEDVPTEYRQENMQTPATIPSIELGQGRKLSLADTPRRFQKALSHLPDDSAHTVQGTEDLFDDDSQQDDKDAIYGEAKISPTERIVYQANNDETAGGAGDAMSTLSASADSLHSRNSWGHMSTGSHASMRSIRDTASVRHSDGSYLGGHSIVRADWAADLDEELRSPGLLASNAQYNQSPSETGRFSLRDSTHDGVRLTDRPQTPLTPVGYGTARLDDEETDTDMFVPRDVTNMSWHNREDSVPVSLHSQTTLSSLQSSPVSQGGERRDPTIRDSWNSVNPEFQQQFITTEGRPRGDSTLNGKTSYENSNFEADGNGFANNNTRGSAYGPSQQRARAESSVSATPSQVSISNSPSRGSSLFQRMRNVFEATNGTDADDNVPARGRSISRLSNPLTQHSDVKLSSQTYANADQGLPKTSYESSNAYGLKSPTAYSSQLPPSSDERIN
ncbi:hypothetical protein BD289DRAFT_413976 [Coniella lustricola]|uniref:Uncharacterized protein n=1 Tax=Coniella lustricola TaxID=2025994 RepID=A0A2T3A0U0_9PEZI|nr:hypothetical protein BD289DRAFT_413976 [Coniella lustricola]